MTSGDNIAHLWLWNRAAGRWDHIGTGTEHEMSIALDSATQGAAALGLNVTYRVDTQRPTPLHAPRRVTLDLPAPTTTIAYSPTSSGEVWRGRASTGDIAVDAWMVERDNEGDLIVMPPRLPDVISLEQRDAWRAFALAVVAATQPRGEAS